jgi:HEAT repeat protein
VIQTELVSAIGKMGEYAQPVVGQLVTMYTDRKNPYPTAVRDSALKAITSLGPVAKEAIPSLINCLGVRGFVSDEFEIAKAFTSIGDAAVEPLVRNLKNPDATVRFVTVRTLGALGPKAVQAIPALEMALQDEHERVRSDAVEALKKIRHPVNKE